MKGLIKKLLNLYKNHEKSSDKIIDLQTLNKLTPPLVLEKIDRICAKNYGKLQYGGGGENPL